MASLPSAQLTETATSERHERILAAAERVFARSGFHAATMSAVAAEAGMSPGNLYRYFSSKDAIIAGMSERDRREIAADFAALDPARGGLLDQLEALGRRHLVGKPREKAIIALQIWAESARNPEMASMCAAISGTVAGGLAEAITSSKQSGELPDDLDEVRFLQAISMLADGFLCHRAINPDFDPAVAAETIFTAMRGLAGIMRRPASDEATP